MGPFVFSVYEKTHFTALLLLQIQRVGAHNAGPFFFLLRDFLRNYFPRYPFTILSSVGVSLVDCTWFAISMSRAIVGVA